MRWMKLGYVLVSAGGGQQDEHGTSSMRHGLLCTLSSLEACPVCVMDLQDCAMLNVEACDVDHRVNVALRLRPELDLGSRRE